MIPRITAEEFAMSREQFARHQLEAALSHWETANDKWRRSYDDTLKSSDQSMESKKLYVLENQTRANIICTLRNVLESGIAIAPVVSA